MLSSSKKNRKLLSLQSSKAIGQIADNYWAYRCFL